MPKHHFRSMPVRYNGRVYRCRLDAKWAVFFDLMDIEYTYRPHTYDLGSLGHYTPTFYLVQSGYFVDVRQGSRASARHIESLRSRAVSLYRGLSAETGCAVLRCVGLPFMCAYNAIAADDKAFSSGWDYSLDTYGEACYVTENLHGRVFRKGQHPDKFLVTPVSPEAFDGKYSQRYRDAVEIAKAAEF